MPQFRVVAYITYRGGTLHVHMHLRLCCVRHIETYSIVQHVVLLINGNTNGNTNDLGLPRKKNRMRQSMLYKCCYPFLFQSAMQQLNIIAYGDTHLQYSSV